MLDYAIRNGTVSAEDIRRVAARLAAFYRNGIAIAIDPATYRSRFLHDIERNPRELSRPEYRLPVERVHDLCRSQRAVLERRRAWFDERVRTGKIVEGHGDLRPEHICLAPEVAVIDCLEFSRDLRMVDPVDELGFLALECERLGAAESGTLLLRTYSEITGDWPGAPPNTCGWRTGICRALFISERRILGLGWMKDQGEVKTSAEEDL